MAVAVNVLNRFFPFGRARRDAQPDWADELVRFVDAEFRRRQEERRPWELQWRLNEEFVNDNQFLEINVASGTVEEVPRLWWWQEREPFNHIAPIYETRVARLARIRPKMAVRPFSASMEDVSAAEVERDLLEYYYHEQGMAERMVRLTHWVELHGTAFLKTVWDPRSGRPVLRVAMTKLDDQGRSVPDPEDTTDEPESVKRLAHLFGGGQPLLELFEGDLATQVVPAYEVYPDSPWRDDMEQVRSIIHARAYPIEQIYDIFNVYVEEEPVDALGGVLSAAVGPGGLGYGAGAYRAQTRRIKGHAIVKEYMERPSATYPQGRYIVVAGGRCLHAGPLPFHVGPNGEPGIPLIRVVSIRRPGCFWGKSVIERLIPVQRRYNALRNRVAEYLARVAIGGWYLPEGYDPDDLVPEPGLAIPWKNPAYKPEPIQWPALPAEFRNEFETLLREFTILSGIGETARFSEAPPGVKSGVALAITVEQDDTRLSSTAMNIGTAVAKLGTYWLRLLKKNVTEPRILRVVGDDGWARTRYWTASSIRSDDVVIEDISSLLETPAQRRMTVMEYLAAGLFNDPETGRLDRQRLKRIYRMLEMGDWEHGLEDYDLHVNKAQRNIRRMLEGQIPPVDSWDDHAVHIQEVNRFRLSTEFENLRRTPVGPLVERLLEWYVQQHALMLMANLQRQIATAAPAAGGPSIRPVPTRARAPEPGLERQRDRALQQFFGR